MQVKVLSIRPVTRDNWRTALELAVRPEQQQFVADYTPIAAIALAKAYIRPAGLAWEPYVFFVDTEMVGFSELAYEPERLDTCWIFHFFIDYRYQGQGYGKTALRLLLQFVRDHHLSCRAVYLTVHPDNLSARRLYTGAGFRPTGDILDGEPVYRLSLL